MALFTRLRVILAVIEGVYGTDPVPTGAANAIRCSNITVTPIGGKTAERQVVYPNFGSLPVALTDKQVLVKFSVELAGSGAAGTAPAYACLLKACGLAETINAGVSAVYQVTSNTPASVTIYANEDGTLHKLTGARGTATFGFSANALPVINFSFVGQWNAPGAVALPVPAYGSFLNALEVNRANTPTFALGGGANVLEKLSLDLGWTVSHRDRPNAEIVQLTNRMCKGSVSFEASPLGTKDFFNVAYTQTLFPLQLVHGTAAGNIIEIDAPAVQMLQPSYADANGIRLLNASLLLTRNNGDDEFVLTVR